MSLLRPLPSLLLALLLTQGCAGTPRPAPAPLSVRPASDKAFLWEVQGPEGRGTAYVVGSVHFAKQGGLELPPSMQEAFARADTLVVEVDPGQVAPEQMQELVRRLGLLPGGQRLSARLNPATQRLLDVELKRANIPRQNLEPLRPWLAAVTLSVLQLQRAGFDGDSGVDALFLARAKAQKKPVHALETAESQVRVLAELPEPLQEQMLRDQLVGMGKNGEQLAFFLEAWTNGDGEAVDAAIQQGASNPELRAFYERVFYERNAQMAEALDALLRTPRTLFVVVGAGHVVGERGVVADLVRRGYTARQLPREAPGASTPESAAPPSPEQAAQPAR
jgi:uncharacterized protein